MARPASLDRDTLVAAALRVTRRVGYNALSMRMVAEELGLSPMAAYRHVPNREALLALVADAVMAPVPVPSPDAGTWDERLRELERAAFRQCSSVRGSAEMSVLGAGPNQQRLADGVMAILTDAGFGEEDAAVAFEVIWAYFHGQLQIYERWSHDNGNDQPAGRNPRLWRGLTNVTERAPRITPEDYFERGFELLLEGLRVRLVEARQAPRRRARTTARDR